MTATTEKRFTDGTAARDEMRTQIFFGNQAHVRGQWPNGRGFTVVITKDDLAVEIEKCETILRRAIAEGAAVDDVTHELALLRANHQPHCDACLHGCECPMNGTESCGHWGCWGPNPTNDCPGVGYARTIHPNEADR